MDNTTEQSNSIIEKEIIEALSTYRTQYTLMTQIVTVIILANVSIIGFALTSNKYELLYLSAFFPILILFVRAKSEQLMLPVVYVAFQLEQSLRTDKDLLATTFLATTYSTSFKDFEKINKLTSKNDRMKALQKLISSQYFMLFRQSNLLVTVLCICATIFQLFLKCYLLT